MVVGDSSEVGDTEGCESLELVGVILACGPGVGGYDALAEVASGEAAEECRSEFADALEVGVVPDRDVPACLVGWEPDRRALALECVAEAVVRDVVIADDFEGGPLLRRRAG